jgi:hypothetical protein
VKPLFAASAILAAALTAAEGQQHAAAMPAPLPAPIAAPQDHPYPGTIRLAVDATDLAHAIFRVHETIPARPGPMVLLFPKWLIGLR